MITKTKHFKVLSEKSKNPFHWILICILVIGLITTVTSGVLKRSKSKTINHYYQSYSFILEGFSQAINYYLINYRSSLLPIIKEHKIYNMSQEELIEILAEEFTHANPDFKNLFYMDKNSIITFSDGHSDDYSDVLSFDTVISKAHPFYVSELVTSREKDNPELLFSIMNPVHDDKGEIVGAIGGSLRIVTIQSVLQSIKLGDIGAMYLQDDKGKFFIHGNKELIGKSYTPNSTKYEKITSEFISQQPDGHIITEDPSGEEIDLFFNHIPHSNWILMIGTPHSVLKEIYSDYTKATILLICLFILCTIILIIQSIITIHYFISQKLKTVDIDPLTNLLTRARFETDAQKLAQKNPKSKFLLIECDIRGFKFINQNYGGEEADKLIVYLSKQLNAMVKENDGLIGRGFADHFYIFVKVTSIHRAIAEFKKYNETLNENIKSYDISFFPKFGISFLMPVGNGPRPTIQDLIGQASFAKSTIKDNMLVHYALYNSHLLKAVNRERFIENNMEAALQNGEFFVLYQPKINLISEKVVGAEALVRWNSPKLGLLRPDEFIPLFERNGFIKKLDFYVYKKVFTFINKMISTNQKMVPISVNMSRNHSKPEKFMHEFLSIFNEFNIPPNMVEVEILERSFMNENTLKTFTDLLHQEGFSVAMDDFGSGESSLNMLTQIPVDVLKFDRTFLVSSTADDGSIDSTSANFIETLIVLSKDLKKQTIFEGVETKEQIEFLKNIECDQVQGYYFSRPLTELDFVEYMKEH